MSDADNENKTYMKVTYQGATYHLPMEYVNNFHPDGPSELLEYEGKNIEERFEDHSPEAEAILFSFEVDANGKYLRTPWVTGEPPRSNGNVAVYAVVGVGLALSVVAAVLLRKYKKL